MLLTKARNTSLVNLASWSSTSTSGNPAPDRKHMSRMIAVERVGTACTLPDSRSAWFWIMSKPAEVVGSPAIQSTPIIPPRRDGSGRGWRSPRGPRCSALVRWQVLGDVDVLTHPEDEASNQGPRLGSPEVPPERTVVALA